MHAPIWSLVLAGCLVAIFWENLSANAQVNITQHGNHLSRDALYIDPAFTPVSAANLARDTNFNGAIVGNCYAQPLYIEGGPRGRAVIIAVTESNNVYSLDATTGKIVWQTNLGTPAPSAAFSCGNISPCGITGTPVVDLPSRSLFVNAVTTNHVTGLPDNLIYSLNVDTGTINSGWPVVVSSNITYGASVFNPKTQGERGALTIIGTNLYVPYGGRSGDCLPYYGWVVSVPINNPSHVTTWATTAQGGGVWAVGGVASDGTDPFIATGNTFNASTWGGGEAILHLSPSLTLGGTTNYWVATNWSSLDQQDLDIGGSGPLLVNVPGATPSQLVAAFGKDQYVYLLNRTNLGGITASLDKFHAATGSIIQSAATYQTSKGTYMVFANNNNLYGLRITATSPPKVTAVWTNSENGRGSPFVTSTDGTNNVIVWGIGSESDNRLHGFDGDTGTNIYTGGGANELMAGTRRFNTGIMARRRFYVANDNMVYAFSLPGQNVTSITMTNMSPLINGGFTLAFTNLPGALFNVFGTTNLAVPFTNWAWLGEATEVTNGQFQFTDSRTNLARFYRVTSP